MVGLLPRKSLQSAPRLGGEDDISGARSREREYLVWAPSDSGSQLTIFAFVIPMLSHRLLVLSMLEKKPNLPD